MNWQQGDPQTASACILEVNFDIAKRPFVLFPLQEELVFPEEERTSVHLYYFCLQILALLDVNRHVICW